MSRSDRPTGFSEGIQDDLGSAANVTVDSEAHPGPSSIQDDLGPANQATPASEIQDDLGPPDRDASDPGVKRWSPTRIAAASTFNVHWVYLAIASLWLSVRYFRTDPVVAGVASIAALGVIAGVTVSTFGIFTRSWRAVSRGKNGVILTVVVTAAFFVLLGMVLGAGLGFVAIPLLVPTVFYTAATSGQSSSGKAARSASKAQQTSKKSVPRPPRPFDTSWSTGLISLSAITVTHWAYLSVARLFFGEALGESTNPLLQSLADRSIVMFAVTLASIRLVWIGNTRTHRRVALAGQGMLLALASLLALRVFLNVAGTARYAFLPVVVLQIALVWWTAKQVGEPSEPTTAAAEEDLDVDAMSASTWTMPHLSTPPLPSDSVQSKKAPPPVRFGASFAIVFFTVIGVHLAYAAGFALRWSAGVFGDSQPHSEIAIVVAAAAMAALAFLALPAVGLFVRTPDTARYVPTLLPDAVVIVGLSFFAFSFVTADGEGVRVFLSLWLTFAATFVATFVRSTSEPRRDPAAVAVDAPSGAAEDATSTTMPTASPVERGWPSGLLFLTTLANVQWVYLVGAMTAIGEGADIGPIDPGSAVRRLVTLVALGVLAGVALSGPATFDHRRSRALMGQWVLLAATVIVMVLLLFSGSAALSLAFVPLLVLQGVLVWWTAAQPESRELSTA